MERQRNIMKNFREQEFSKKLNIAVKTRAKGYENKMINAEDLVLYQVENKKAWRGRVKVFTVKGNSVFLFANRNLKKIPICNIKLYKRKEVDFVKESKDMNEEEDEKDDTVEESNVMNEEEDKKNDRNYDYRDNIKEDDVEDIRKMKNRSMTDLEKDNISTFLLKTENRECYEEITMYAVEVLISEHKKPEVMEANDR